MAFCTLKYFTSVTLKKEILEMQRITVCCNYLNTNEAKHSTQKDSNITTKLLLHQVVTELLYLVFNSW